MEQHPRGRAPTSLPTVCCFSAVVLSLALSLGCGVCACSVRSVWMTCVSEAVGFYVLCLVSIE